MEKMRALQKLLDATGYAITGVSLGDSNDPSTWRVDFADGTSFYYRDAPADDRERSVADAIAVFT